MNRELLDRIYILRSELHTLAELSEKEKRTKAHLIKFLSENTSLRIEDNGRWFCAVHEEPGACDAIAFRAEMDALPYGRGASHLCGHDGHSAVLAGLGMLLENKVLGRNVVLIFQHAEETGTGGKLCCKAVQKHHVSRVYAFHNIPGWPQGAILLRHGTFACASRGMKIAFTGMPTHAAYPENGKNPGFAAARFIAALPGIAGRDGCRGLTMATLIGAQIGAKAFGSAAGNAEVWLTLRSWYNDDLEMLLSLIEKSAAEEAKSDTIEVKFSFNDIFPACVNDDGTIEQLKKTCHKIGLDCAAVTEPFRWSEDFGYYGADAKAVMVGIGSGVAWPQLHTKKFEFNDKIIPVALKLFSSLAESE